MIKELSVSYAGRVQGVGFRATVQDISQKFNVTGWVANVSDGTVRLLAEAATELELLRFRDAIVSSLSRNIVTSQETFREKNQADFGDFTIAPDLPR